MGNKPAKTAPDWRWTRAQRYCDLVRKPPGSADHWVRRAYKFKKRHNQNNVMSNARLERDYPDLYRAFGVYDNPADGTKWIIEAGVLAQMDAEFLAEHLGIEASIIEVYEEVFFDVRWAIGKHPGWITSKVLMPGAKHGLLKNDPDQMWKTLALDGGWDALMAFWRTGKFEPTVLDFFDAAIAAEKKKNALVAAKTTEINGLNAVDHIQIDITTERMKKEFGGTAAGSAEAALGGLLDAIDIEVHKARAVLPQEEQRLQLPPPADIFNGAREENKGDKDT